MATETLREPKTAPTTVGITAKKPPFAIPLIITKAISGPREFEIGQITSMEIPETINETRSVFNGPIKSALSPSRSLPIALEKLNPATRPAPAESDSPMLLEYRGRKNGGTKSGNVARAPAKKRTMKRLSRRRLLSIKGVAVIGALSLIR
jgi:hypothetical protein